MISIKGVTHRFDSLALLELSVTRVGVEWAPDVEAGIAFVIENHTAGKFTLTTSLMSPDSSKLLNQLMESLERDVASHLFPGASTKGVESF